MLLPGVAIESCVGRAPTCSNMTAAMSAEMAHHISIKASGQLCAGGRPSIRLLWVGCVSKLPRDTGMRME